ncbi:MAG: hypothetical protein IJ486_02450 [Firmicutes bacterium]|nr:hypothetical protein [Bacillota bacterium]
MTKKLSAEKWIEACKKIIAVEDPEGLRNVLKYLDDAESYLVFHAREELLQFVVDTRALGVMRVLLEHEQFEMMGIQLVQMALEKNDPEILELALEYTNPNALVYDAVREDEEQPSERYHPGMYCEGINYFVTAEPLGVCAIRGKKELAEILLKHGARPEGAVAEDIMEKKTTYLRPLTFSRLEIVVRREGDGAYYNERCEGLRRLPPWAYGMFCKDPEAAEFFLGLGEDRYTMELAMAVTLVQSGEIIRILQKKKPKLMAAIEPKYILRRFQPEVVKQYFSTGREIPENAIQLIGQYIFDEYDLTEVVDEPGPLEFREDDFVETLKYLLNNGYRLTKDDLEILTFWMVMFRSERLLQILKGKIPAEMDVSAWLNALPVDGKNRGFVEKLVKNGVRFRCVLGPGFKCYRNYQYMELARLFKLVKFERHDPEMLDQLSISALFSRSKKAMALLWKEGLINEKNLSQAVKLICDLQLTELYEFSAELAGTSGGSEVRYEL